MSAAERMLVTAGRAAQILGLADRRGAHRLVDERLLTPFTGWTLEGVDKKPQLMFRLIDVRALLLARQERVGRRSPKRWTPGSQLAFVWPSTAPAKPLPWPRLAMAKAQLSLKRRLEIEGRAKARQDGRPVKGPRLRKESRHVA
jgi:hypothetical protein